MCHRLRSPEPSILLLQGHTLELDDDEWRKHLEYFLETSKYLENGQKKRILQLLTEKFEQWNQRYQVEKLYGNVGHTPLSDKEVVLQEAKLLYQSHKEHSHESDSHRAQGEYISWLFQHLQHEYTNETAKLCGKISILGLYYRLNAYQLPHNHGATSKGNPSSSKPWHRNETEDRNIPQNSRHCSSPGDNVTSVIDATVPPENIKNNDMNSSTEILSIIDHQRVAMNTPMDGVEPSAERNILTAKTNRKRKRVATAEALPPAKKQLYFLPSSDSEL